MGDFRHGETSFEILGLTQGNCYSIRVTAINALGHQVSAPVIRVQTGHSAQENTTHGENPEARILATESCPDLAEVPGGIKDVTGTSQQNTRNAAHRASFVAAQSSEMNGESAVLDGLEGDESPENIRRLTGNLESLKRQKEDVEKQIEDEDLDARDQIAEITKERDHLRQAYRDKEETSAELRRHGNVLDKLNRTAQSRKSTKEKLLQQKRSERQKLKDDTERWGEEITEMEADIEEMEEENGFVIREKDDYVEQKKQAVAEDQAAIKALEEDIRLAGVQIKALEQRRDETIVDEDETQTRSRAARAKDEAWELRYQSMQAQLTLWRQYLQQASIEEQQTKEQLAWWHEKHASSSMQPAPSLGLDYPSLSRNKSRRGQHSNSRSSVTSSPHYQGALVASSGELALPNSLVNAAPIFSMGNGTAMLRGDETTDLGQAEADSLAGATCMSPAANELLPSNLFRDEELTNPRTAPNPESLGNVNGDAHFRHALSNSDASNRGPHTPVSADSQTGSILPSPQESTQNLHPLGLGLGPGGFEDGDLRPIDSAPASLHPSLTVDSESLPSTRFASLFSSPFHRQRGKSSGDEPPLLGTLKHGQSQSFPRKLEPDDVEAANRWRRRGASGWGNPMAGLLARNSTAPASDAMITARTSSGRKSRMNVFGSKMANPEMNPFTEFPPPSRPSSTYSHDQSYARPSDDSQRGFWPAPEGMPNRNNPLFAHWAPANSPWSHLSSRRPSLTHGSSTNLSVGSTPLDPDDYLGQSKKQKSDQAPIGTRPLSAQQPAIPKLNPAARPFQMLFSRGEAKKGGKSSSKTSDNPKKDEIDDPELVTDNSPPVSRQSRDAQSITTAASTADSHESFDRSTSGTGSEAVTPSNPKASFMQKITRKSSSSKFNVPWSKDRAGVSLFSKRAEDPSTPGEADETSLSEGLQGKGTQSAGSTPQQDRAGRGSISWTGIRRKSKMGDIADKDGEVGESGE